LHKHEQIMACTHVIDESKPVGEIDDEIKDDTLICQKCIDLMIPDNNETKASLPDQVHLYCKHCIMYKLKKSIR